MQRRTDLDDLDVVVRRQSGLYFARVPQVGLYATAATLPKALEALEAKKKGLLEELTAANALDEISVAPFVAAARKTMLPVLALFLAKGVIVVALFVGAVAYARHAVQHEIDRYSAMHGGAMFWTQFEIAIERAADPSNDLPAAKKQALLANLHVLVDRWRPFVSEAERLFSDKDAVKQANP